MFDGLHGNPMAEIALALAMSFFSIMILAMVSMGAEFRQEKTLLTGMENSIAIMPSRTEPVSPSVNAESGASYLVVHYQGAFFNKELKPIDVGSMDSRPSVTLAIEPSMSVVDALKVRAQIPVADLIVTTLDKRWIQRLRRN